MYFSSRHQAAIVLASKIVPKYRYENCIVIALNEGGLTIAIELAKELHCLVTMLLTEDISLPREPTAIGGVTSDGKFSYNSEYSDSEVDELNMEFHNYIEEEKYNHINHLHRILKGKDLLDKRMVIGRSVILVSDGFKTTMSLDLAYQFLKSISIEKLIVATPLAEVKVADWMHIHADEIYCLQVIENYISNEHYYEKNDILDQDKAVNLVQNIVLNWK